MSNKKKHIVLVTHYFTPYNNVAANRMNAIAVYLPQDKFKLSVLTLKRDNDASFSTELNGVEVYREKSSGFFKRKTFEKKVSPFRHKMKVAWNVIISKMINDENYWVELGVKRLQTLNESNEIDLIISSFGPLAPHKLVLKFIENNKKVKWITDMRDEMSANPFIESSLRSKYIEIESQIANKADGLCSVSQPILDDFEKKMNGSSLKYKLVKNGFDHERTIQSKFNSVFTITYVGTFYGERKPGTFFSALTDLLNKGSIPNVKIVLVGTPHNFIIPKKLESHITWVDKVSNTEAVDYMEKSDVNLLIHPRSKVKGIYTGKLFEYLSVQRPVLALVDTEDVAAQLIELCSGGFSSEFDDIEEIQKNILSCYALWAKKETLNFNLNEIGKLHRSKQVQILSNFIEEIIEG